VPPNCGTTRSRRSSRRNWNSHSSRTSRSWTSRLRAGVPLETRQDYRLVDALQEIPPPRPGCFRYCHVTLAGGVDPLRGEIADRVGHMLWNLLEGKDGPDAPPAFLERHLVADADLIGVWSRHGFIIAAKENAHERAGLIRSHLEELAWISRDTEDLMNRPAVERDDPNWAPKVARRVDDGERLMRRVIKLKYSVGRPDRRVLQQFFEAMRLDEVVRMLRDVNAMDVERSQADRMGENTEKIQEHIESVAEGPVGVPLDRDFPALGLRGGAVPHARRELPVHQVLYRLRARRGGVHRGAVHAVRDAEGQEGDPGYMKAVFVGMAIFLVAFLGLGLVMFREEVKSQVDQAEASASQDQSPVPSKAPDVGGGSSGRGPAAKGVGSPPGPKQSGEDSSRRPRSVDERRPSPKAGDVTKGVGPSAP